ncbi:MAG: DNA primase DnaG [Candidatus Aenigmatarchaeota archaeon]
MGKLAQAASKYTIVAAFEADGTVEKPDVIGAVFGQTEGLLGPDMDLRELQRTGRIGRIDVDMKIKGGKASGTIVIPSSMDSSETALIAAAVETIERVGPCNARLAIEKVEDVRAEKRKYVIERAKQLLARIFEEGAPEAAEITEQIKEAVRKGEVTDYHGFPAGPEAVNSDSLIIVEGRADVVNLLRCGIKNTVAIEGTSVPPAIAELSRKKETTAFLDGDRGGDLILKELAAVGEIDFVARAPTGKEVEELTKKEIFKALRERVPLTESKVEGTAGEIREAQEAREARAREMTEEAEEISRREERPRKERRGDHEKAELFRTLLNELTGTRAAYLLDESGNPQGKVPVREMFNALKELSADALVFDGEVDQKLVNFAASRGVHWLVGMKASPRIRVPENMYVVVLADLQ